MNKSKINAVSSRTDTVSMRASLLKAVSGFASMTLVSRVLGFVRDVLLARYFGASAGFDAFVVAFKIPNFMRRLFAEGAFSQAFVPVLSEYQSQGDKATTQMFINRMFTALFLSVFAFVGLSEWIVPWIVTAFAPGFAADPLRFGLASHMLHIILPYLVLVTLTAFSAAILNCYRQFAIPAFVPVLLNVSLITSAVVWAPWWHVPVLALAWGVVVGGMAQLLVLVGVLWRRGLLPRFDIHWNDAGVKKMGRLLLPALFGVSVVQLGLLVDTLFASFLPVGSVSWLFYSERLTFFPLGVFGVAISTVILPYLSRLHSNASQHEFKEGLDWALRNVCVLGIPAALGLLMLAVPLMATLFQYGVFLPKDVKMAAHSLMAFSLGLPAFMWIKVLGSGFYARQNIKTPVKVAAVALLANIILNVLLIGPLAHAGLALATSIAAWVNAGVLLGYLWRKGIYAPSRAWFGFAGQCLFANGLMGAWLWWCVPDVSVWLEWGGLARYTHLLAWIGSGMLVYFGSLWCSGYRLRGFKG